MHEAQLAGGEQRVYRFFNFGARDKVSEKYLQLTRLGSNYAIQIFRNQRGERLWNGQANALFHWLRCPAIHEVPYRSLTRPIIDTGEPQLCPQFGYGFVEGRCGDSP